MSTVVYLLFGDLRAVGVICIFSFFSFLFFKESLRARFEQLEDARKSRLCEDPLNMK